MNIFVGNLSFDAIEADVKKLFEGFGNVLSAAIVMEKEKKAPKSRGFGFVEMPDEQQALAAIAVLNGKEFMGRALNVAPARPKAETQAVVEVRKRSPAATPNPSGGIGVPLSAAKKAWYRPVFKKTARYKSGRRTHSYMKRQALAGVQVDAKPRRSSQDNPLRWLKKKNQAKPWQKSMGEHKPWKKSAGDAKPRRKSAGYKR
ncbi:MAG: hypothetical protein NTU54_04680 [Candidatus Omnitrophica bacterium]|nr:hypothetical protein [Candidatus Omnitrophota bacterium]